MMEANNKFLKKATGLLVIEVRNSNPNGDPDRESDPRQRFDDRGEISPVSFKRKVRDLVGNTDGPVWQEISGQFSPELKPENFCILESRGRDRAAILKEIEKKDKTFELKYWDGRIFGNTFLEEGASTSIRTGVVQFGMGVSVSPVEIERQTNTSKSGVQEGKDRGMAPLGYRIVSHGVYTIPFFVNPTAATKSGCTQKDIDLLLKIIPYAYSHTASYVRPSVGIRHAWYIEHKSVLGSCSDFDLLDALTPEKKDEPEKPSFSWGEYDVPVALPQELQYKVEPLRDLVAE
jgi:CRISPR-associated protein Csd2